MASPITRVRRLLGHAESAEVVEPGPAVQAAATPADQPTRGRRIRWDYEGRPVLDCLVAYNRYGGYVVPRSAVHRAAAKKVMAGRVYEPETIKLIRSECGGGDVVHAGTFFGDFLPGLSSAMSPGARIFAFEPNPESHRCASMTAAINGIDNVVLTRAGLGAARGVAEMVTLDEEGMSRGGSSRVLRVDERIASSRIIEIPIATVDESVPTDRALSVLQLDLEGHEQLALDGAMGTIRRCRPLIILETLPDPDWIGKHLAPLGYQVAERVHHNTVLRVS